MTSGKFVELPDARRRVSVHGHKYSKIIEAIDGHTVQRAREYV
jgi:hypothetical protein